MCETERPRVSILIEGSNMSVADNGQSWRRWKCLFASVADLTRKRSPYFGKCSKIEIFCPSKVNPRCTM